MSTGTIPVVQPEPQPAGEARRTAELEASQSLAHRYAELAHTFEPRPVDAVLRGFDIVISGLILLVFSPLIAVLALAVLLTSGRPILYQGARVGRAGRTFHMYKLRTLRPDAEARLGPYQATELDRRTLQEVTRLGALLRASQLDELPQLWNVLRGEMSLVGPRPERPEFVAELEGRIPFYRARLLVKPGITGWAQIKFRYGSSTDDALVKLQYDLYYVKHRSLVLDALILAKTIGVVVRLGGT